MWESQTMNLSQSLMFSVMGISIVIMVLLLLALAIVTFSKLISAFGLGDEKKVAAPVQSQSTSQKDELDEESYAVLMAAVCEEIKQPPHKFKIVEIKEMN